MNEHARSLMLELHRAGHLELPAKRVSPPNNAVVHGRAVWTCQPERQSQLGLGLKPVPLECSGSLIGFLSNDTYWIPLTMLTTPPFSPYPYLG
jgi:hypothetical protein